MCFREGRNPQPRDSPVRQQEREPRVAGGRSSPHVKANLISEKRNGDGQSECHVPEVAVVGSKDTCTQGSTDSANRNAEIKVDGDPGGVTVGHDHTATHTWANPSLRNGNITSRSGGDEPRIGPGSSKDIQDQESSQRANPYAEGRPEDGGLGMDICNIGVGTWESSHSIHIDGESQLDGYGKGMAVGSTREDNSVTNRGAMGQPEGGGMRMADIHRWENPDSAGGLARGPYVGGTMIEMSGGEPQTVSAARARRAPHRRIMALGRRLIRVKRNL